MTGKKRKLLIIDKHQFGYLTDAYKWCEWLKSDYDISFLTADVGYEKIDMPGVKVSYISFRMPKILRGCLFIFAALMTLSFFRGAVVIEYFQGCSILKRLCPWKKLMVDVRTLSVSPDLKHRESYNRRLIRDCGYFDLVSAISKGVAKQIGINGIRVLPLGSDIISQAHKIYDDGIRMLYVGTFRWRKLEIVLEGLKLFIDRHQDIDVSFDIIGDGDTGQLDNLKEHANLLRIEDVVTFHGFIPLTKIKPFVDDANVGIAFIPITEYYDYQPPTKTYEYVLSGLYCIATKTKANAEIITQENGCLIYDTPESVCQGIERYWQQRKRLKEDVIRSSLVAYKWENIIRESLLPLLNKL